MTETSRPRRQSRGTGGRSICQHTSTHSDNEPFELEVFLDDRFADEWVLRRVPWLGVRIDHAVSPSAWGVPTAAAEVLLFLKATSHVRELRQGPRPRDEDDFRALLPQLQRPQIEWLKGAISSVQPGHRWIEQLEP